MQVDYRNYAVSLCFMFAAITTMPAQSADLPGSLDRTFGKVTTGLVATDFYTANLGFVGAYSHVATQSDRKVVVFGHENKLLRFGVDGRADASFGINGVVATGNFAASYIGDVALQADGKIVIAGHDGIGSTYRLERYNGNGTLDSSFGVNGVVQTSMNAYNDGYIRSLVIQSDGKLLIAGNAVVSSECYYDGFTTACTYTSNGVLGRYNADGSADTSFGSNGFVIKSGTIQDIAIDVFGRIVAVGSSPLLSRYDSHGALDATFGNAGVVEAAYGGGDVELYGDGRILISAGTGLVRLLSNGAIDNGFGLGGTVTVPSPEGIVSMALIGDEIILGGARTTYTQTNKQYWAWGSGYVYLTNITKVFCVSRYRGNGALDSSFGEQGVAVVSFNGNDTLTDLAIDAAGKIVLVGATDRDPATSPLLSSNFRYENQFALARLNR